MTLISLEDARAHVFGGCARLEPQTLPVAEVSGCVAADEVVAGEAIPPFDNTAMDGFAVRASDTAGASSDAPVSLPIVATLPAGAAPDRAVGPGEAIRIMTGAPLPEGADAVVMVERTRTNADGTVVEVGAEVEPGQHVRTAGDDLRPGDRVFAADTVLTPGHLGVLASLGITELSVYPRARVGVLSTGDELVDDGSTLEPGQIRDSNRVTLLAMVVDAGCLAVDLGCIRDDEALIEAAIARGVLECDALVTSGGVSMGDFDYVKAVLDRIGDMRWMQVAIRPAKPLAFGTVAREGAADAGDRRIPVFGLPGNPVSSMVSFELFARPALRSMMGHPIGGSAQRTQIAAIADEPLPRRPDGKVHFARVVGEWHDDSRYHVRSAGGQGSHQLTAMAGATALAVLEDGDGVDAGATVPVMLLG